MLFQFPLPFLAPPFYQLDFSEVVALIGTFALGPGAGVLIELIKNLLNLLLTGTETGFVGELANFLIGCTYVLPAALFYHGKKKSLRRALIGMACGTLSLAVCGALFNYYILIPFYSTQYALPLEEIVAMLHRMLESDPLKRYDDTSVLARDLEYFIYKDGYGPTIVTLADYMRKLMPGRFGIEPEEDGAIGDDDRTIVLNQKP